MIKPMSSIAATAAAAVLAAAMPVRSVIKDFLSRELRGYTLSKVKDVIASFSSELTLVIDEFDDLTLNHLYGAAELYIQNIIPPDTKRIRVNMAQKDGKISTSLEKEQEIVDTFNGVQLKWKFVCKKASYVPSSDHYGAPVMNSKIRQFELSFHKEHKEMVMNDYLQHVVEKARELKVQKKTLKLFTLKYDQIPGNRKDIWQSFHLNHPATFDTLAADTEVIRTILEDLDQSIKRKEYYKRVGKAWKRKYLLFGPPGTGKSSLIASMAHYLKFDIYNLELTALRGNCELTKLLNSIGNKSIVAVEDSDCSIELQNRLAGARTAMSRGAITNQRNQGPQVTLSGLLNSMDKLWSSCEDERIIVFTTNHKDRLEAGLLRPGRMDLHIHMSYCTPCGFQKLALIYLGITEHPLFLEIEELLEVMKVTPAELSEQVVKDEDPETALRGLIEFLNGKRAETPEAKRKEKEQGGAEFAENLKGTGAA